MLRYIVLLFLPLGGFGCVGAGPAEDPAAGDPRVEIEEGGNPVKMVLTSEAFKAGERIPKEYTGEGIDKSPPLSWSDVPEGTKSFALICDDPDAPTKEPWVHWVIYNIPANTTSLSEGVANDATLKEPRDAMQGKNSWGSGRTIGYRGPMPPPGHGTHHYHFVLYALDTKPDFKPEMEKNALIKGMEGHVVGKAKLIGTYSR